jgi:hypothetical protein
MERTGAAQLRASMVGKFDRAGLSVAILLMVAQTATAQNPIQKWQRLTADNGAGFAVDLNSISRFSDGSVWMITCALDNDRCPPPNQSRFKFDCRGHYLDIDRHGSLQIAPPQSVVGRMAEIACNRSTNTGGEPAQRPAPTSDQKAAIEARKAIASCLISESTSSPYSNDDVPKVEDVRIMNDLLDRCKRQRDDWQKQCSRDGNSLGYCATIVDKMVFHAVRMIGR